VPNRFANIHNEKVASKFSFGTQHMGFLSTYLEGFKPPVNSIDTKAKAR